MKRFFTKLNLVFVLVLVASLMSGCGFFFDFEDTADKTADEIKDMLDNNFIFDYKVAYKNDEVIALNYSVISEAIIGDFVKTFGSGSATEIPADDLFYDSIRYEAYETTENVEGDFANRWIWSFGYNYSDGGYLSYLFDGTDLSMVKANYYSGVNAFYEGVCADYLQDYLDFFSEQLEFVMFDIAFGLEPREYDVSIAVDTGVPTLTLKEEFADYEDDLAVLQAKFEKLSSYSGFSQINAEILKDYILENVIGDQAVANMGDRDYEGYLDDLMQTFFDEEDGLYSAVARASYIDTNKLVPDSNSTLDAVESHEYSSAVIMPSEDAKVISYMISIESEDDLVINLYLRHYNADNDSVATTTPVQVSITGGVLYKDFFETYGELYNAEVYPVGEINLPQFDNNDNIKAEAQKDVIRTDVVKNYKTLSSINGLGDVSVLSEDAVPSSFLEIVFDVQKTLDDAVDKNYNFKFAVSVFN